MTDENVDKKTKLSDNPILEPLLKTGAGFYGLFILMGIIVLVFAYAWYTQLTQGLSVTGMRDLGVTGGAPWGIYISTFIWWVGIAHGGIAVSAAIRLMKLELYKPIARIAEVITPITLAMAGLSIVLDMGRPDRIFNMVLYYTERISSSPLIWDLTVILVYMAFSVTYLTITLREDLAELIKENLPKSRLIRLLYKFFLIGYNPKEKAKMEQMAWWLGLSLIVLMALLSGGVIPWLFGLQVSRAGWFGAVLGPYFLTAAVTSAIAAVIIVAAIVRSAYNWQKYIQPRIFQGLGKALAIGIILYLWFILHEQITMQYAGPVVDKQVSDSMLFGQYAPMFWLVTGGLIVTFIYFAIQAVNPKMFSLLGTTFFSGFVVVLFWIKRYLIMIPPLSYNQLPNYPTGNYTPTWIEWALVSGTIAIAVLLLMFFFKFFPAMELKTKAPEKVVATDGGDEKWH